MCVCERERERERERAYICDLFLYSIFLHTDHVDLLFSVFEQLRKCLRFLSCDFSLVTCFYHEFCDLFLFSSDLFFSFLYIYI